MVPKESAGRWVVTSDEKRFQAAGRRREYRINSLKRSPYKCRCYRY